jgi:DNA-binding PadR family transcriptional regulator
MHGHAIRLLAEQEHIDMWADFAVGAIYGVIKRLAAEGLIEELRVEREGNYPERSVYSITAAGEESLNEIRREGLEQIVLRPDPVDLALARLNEQSLDELPETLDVRLSQLRSRLELAEKHVAGVVQYLTLMEQHIMRHQFARLRAEIQWHEDLIAALPAIDKDERSRKQRKKS